MDWEDGGKEATQNIEDGEEANSWTTSFQTEIRRNI